MRPNSAYERFVDELVELARVNVTAKHIRRYGHSERTNDEEMALDQDEQRRRNFFLTLSPDDRELVAEMLEEEFSSAIHKVASFLEHALSCDNMKISWNGANITASPYVSMHYDYTCRRSGDAWPDEAKQ